MSDRKVCWKFRHATRGDANKTLRALNQKRGKGLQSYWCDLCEAWHVGHSRDARDKEKHRKAKARYAA